MEAAGSGRARRVRTPVQRIRSSALVSSDSARDAASRSQSSTPHGGGAAAAKRLAVELTREGGKEGEDGMDAAGSGRARRVRTPVQRIRSSALASSDLTRDAASRGPGRTPWCSRRSPNRAPRRRVDGDVVFTRGGRTLRTFSTQCKIPGRCHGRSMIALSRYAYGSMYPRATRVSYPAAAPRSRSGRARRGSSSARRAAASRRDGGTRAGQSGRVWPTQPAATPRRHAGGRRAAV